MSAEELRQKLYALCGRSVVCRRAADYYVEVLQNPCYPPAVKLTKKALHYYMEFVKKYGWPHCDVKTLVEERLRGTWLERYIGEIAELAELIRRQLRVTSRVAAAAATILVAERRGLKIVRGSVAAYFKASDVAVRACLKRVYASYSTTKT